MGSSDEQTAPVKRGDVLAGKYRVDEVLGLGGMGVVVAATHLELEQRVALKFLLPDAMEKPAIVERFSREARAAVRLKSEHVARVIDVGKLPGGAPYIVMELLVGIDLAALLEERGACPFADAVGYLLQACEAVAEAHALGIIHRDLKPRNLFLTKRVDGRPLVKVLDFGIAKVRDSSQDSIRKLSLTKTADVMGSPMYMSPEQLRSARDVDERADIWALGAILYELLTGVVPFEAESVTQLCARVLEEVPRPVVELRPEVPPGLGAIVVRCLEKRRDDRYRSVADLADALEPFAPPDARGAGARIRAVGLEAAPRSLVPSGPVSSRVAVTGGTSVSWGETELAGAPSKRARRVVPIAIGATVAIAAGALAFAFTSRPAPSAEAAHPELPSAAPASPSPPLTLASGGSPATSDAPPASAAPSASIANGHRPVVQPPPAPPPPAPSHTAVIAPPPTPPTPQTTARPRDDMPSDRH